MMSFNKVKVVIVRELREKLFSKTFIVMTLLIPGIILLTIGIQAFFKTYDDDVSKQIVIVAETPELKTELQNKFSEKDFVKEKKIVLTYETLSRSAFEKELAKLRPALADGSLSGVVFIPQTALRDKKIYYYSKTPNDKSVTYKLNSVINDVLVSEYFRGKGINENDLEFAKKSVDVKEMKVTEKSIAEQNRGGEILTFVFVFFLYMSLLTSGQLVLRSVVEEKQNRIVEVLLSSINTNELMAGKILGSSVTAFAQMLIWLAPVVVAFSTSWLALPKELTIVVPAWQWVYFLFNFVLGLITFLGLFAATGALFDNEQDAQTGMWPLMLLIMIPFFIAFSLMNNPTNSLGRIASFVPFSAFFVMPARIGMLDVPTYEVILSIIVNLITLLLIIPVTGKIYRIAVLKTGKKPSWSEIIKWLRS
jgi:ABC-2 type transport system permease protein